MDTELKNHIAQLMSKGKRIDGRKPLEYRQPIALEYGVIETAEGSAKVQIGDTVVIAGVKLGVEKPYPDTPNTGSLMVGAELLPLSNPDFEVGAPGFEAIELGRVVDRGIRESKAIDTKKLCIKEGEKVWIVMIDICTINDAGNLFDASALAAVAAIKDTRFPKYENEKIDYKIKTEQGLPLNKVPVSVTVRKIGNTFFIDSNSEEEKATDARLTVAIDEDGNLVALQKGGDKAISAQDVDEMIGIALDKEKELRTILG